MGVCTLCPHMCRVDRENTVGRCGAKTTPRIARAALHMWEEPCISGTHGSGTIFFCGCNLRCVFCQNHEISTNAEFGRLVTASEISDIMFKLRDDGAENINFVTPTPHVVTILKAIELAKQRGLTLPIIYNTNSYITLQTLDSLEGLIDIYIPDLKYVTPMIAKKYSGVGNYPEHAVRAIAKMFAQCGQLILDDSGMAKSGVIIRHLVLPGNVDETRRVLNCIKENFSDEANISLMAQYFPSHMAKNYPPLDRKLLAREYDRAVRHALDIGLKNVLIQASPSADSAYVPPWDISK